MTTKLRKPRKARGRKPHPIRTAFEASSSEEQQALLARIRELLEGHDWHFAKTMAENPHWYTLRKKWSSDDDFCWVVEHIRALGVWRPFKKARYLQLDLAGFTYWTMGWKIGSLDWGWPRLQVAGTILINRKPIA